MPLLAISLVLSIRIMFTVPEIVMRLLKVRFLSTTYQPLERVTPLSVRVDILV